MQTDQLIGRLTEVLEPVRPLPSPWRRAAVWTLVGAIYLALLVLIASPREDLAVRVSESRFVVEQLAALLTGVLAAFAALASVIPGSHRRVVWLPFAGLALWLAVMAAGAVQDTRAFGQLGLWAEADWRCVGTILVGAAVPALAIARMVRRGVALSPRLTVGLSILAAAGLGNLGVCLFHPHTSNVTVLVWHGGTVVALALLAAWCGAPLFRWQPQPSPR